MDLSTYKNWSWRNLRWVGEDAKTLRDQDITRRVNKNLNKWLQDQAPIGDCRSMREKNLREKLSGELGTEGRIEHRKKQEKTGRRGRCLAWLQ